MGKSIEVIEFLARSETRVELLETLKERRGASGRDLKAEFDVSRTTIQRNLDKLESQGWIRTTAADTYTLTPAGEQLIDGLLDLAEVARVAIQFQPMVQWIPADEFSLDIRHLADADLLVPKSGEPYSILNRHIKRLKQMEECRALLPVTGLHAHETAHERVVNNDVHAEVVVVPEVAETYRSDPQYAELTDQMVETGRFTEFVYDGPIPYSIVLFEDIVQIVAISGDEPQALVETDTAEVYAWAEDVYEKYKDRATRIH